jgi:hypothetical protein
MCYEVRAIHLYEVKKRSFPVSQHLGFNVRRFACRVQIMMMTIILGFISSVWLAMYAYKYQETLRAQGRDLARYTDNGRCFMRDGQVICFACKKTGTVPRKVVGPAHVRRHFCVNCGLGLFYSSVRQEQARDPLGFPSLTHKL